MAHTILDGTGRAVASVYSLEDAELFASAPTMRAHIDALEARERELVGRLSSQSVALEAIAGMTIDDRTDHAQLSALMKAIAKQSIEGAI